MKYKIVRNAGQKDKFDIMEDQKAIFQLLTYEQAAMIIEGLKDKQHGQY